MTNPIFYRWGVKLALKTVGLEEAKRIGKSIGIDWAKVEFAPEQLRKGIEVEQEHGKKLGPKTDVGADDLRVAARIALAHLKELRDYYTRLDKMEKKANGDEVKGPGKPVDVNSVIAWFKQHPNPSDKQVHEYAEEKGYNPHSLEAAIYRLATKAVRRM